MVLGIDPHKKSHTVVALEAATGELVAELTVAADRRGHERLIAWARPPHSRATLRHSRTAATSPATSNALPDRPPASVACACRRSSWRRRAAAPEAAARATPSTPPALARAALRRARSPRGPPRGSRARAAPARRPPQRPGRRTRIGASRAACAGTCTASASASRCLRRLWAAPAGSPASRRSSRPSRASRRASPASSRGPLPPRSRPRSPAWGARSPCSPRSLAPELLALPGSPRAQRRQPSRRDGRGRALRQRAARFAMHAGVAPLPVSQRPEATATA